MQRPPRGDARLSSGNVLLRADGRLPVHSADAQGRAGRQLRAAGAATWWTRWTWGTAWSGRTPAGWTSAAEAVQVVDRYIPRVCRRTSFSSRRFSITEPRSAGR